MSFEWTEVDDQILIEEIERAPSFVEGVRNAAAAFRRVDRYHRPDACERRWRDIVAEAENALKDAQQQVKMREMVRWSRLHGTKVLTYTELVVQRERAVERASGREQQLAPV